MAEIFIWSFPRASREELGSCGYVPLFLLRLHLCIALDMRRLSLPVLQEIPPFETKGVMRASFSSRDVDNHTAFIRIKTNAPDEDQFIILPVEVEVTSGSSKHTNLPACLPSSLSELKTPSVCYPADVFLLLLQLLVFTPLQRCLTLVHCDHKVPVPNSSKRNEAPVYLQISALPIM